MKRVKYDVRGIDCANCGYDIERRLSKIPSVYECDVNHLFQKITIVLDEDVISPEELGQNFNKFSTSKLTILNITEVRLTEEEIENLRKQKEESSKGIDIKQMIFGRFKNKNRRR